MGELGEEEGGDGLETVMLMWLCWVVADVEVCCIFGVRGIWAVGLVGEVCFMAGVGTDWWEEPALT